MSDIADIDVSQKKYCIGAFSSVPTLLNELQSAEFLSSKFVSSKS